MAIELRRAVVSIIGGGWSLRELGDPGRARIPGFKIGVNDSMLLANCDTGVSMDRLWLENRIERANERVQSLWARRSALVNVKKHYAFVRRFECDHETALLADKPGWLNGPNSGHCALNLAYKMRPKSIVLWGFDFNRSPTGEVYWYDPYPWSKPNPGGMHPVWATMMAAPLRQCREVGVEVLNASPSSAIGGTKKVDPWTLLT